MTDLRYSTTDECPTCKKLIKNMFEEHRRLVCVGNLIVCVRCGCVFLPRSQIKHILEGGESRIIDPNSIGGQIKLP